MLGIVLAGHTGFASGTLKSLKHLLGALPEQCISVEYTDWLSTNMLSRMMCDALHAVFRLIQNIKIILIIIKRNLF